MSCMTWKRPQVSMAISQESRSLLVKSFLVEEDMPPRMIVLENLLQRTSRFWRYSWKVGGRQGWLRQRRRRKQKSRHGGRVQRNSIRSTWEFHHYETLNSVTYVRYHDNLARSDRTVEIGVLLWVCWALPDREQLGQTYTWTAGLCLFSNIGR